MHENIQENDGYCLGFEVTGDSLEILKLAVSCLFKSNLHKPSKFYAIIEDSDGGDVLLLSKSKTSYKGTNLMKLPYDLKTEDMLYNFIKNWLESSNRVSNDPDGYPGFTIKIPEHSVWDGIISVEHTEFICGQ